VLFEPFNYFGDHPPHETRLVSLRAKKSSVSQARGKRALGEKSRSASRFKAKG
jgi:hypothetical protein